MYMYMTKLNLKSNLKLDQKIEQIVQSNLSVDIANQADLFRNYSREENIAINVFNGLRKKQDSVDQILDLATKVLSEILDCDVKYHLFKKGDEFDVSEFKVSNLKLETILADEEVLNYSRKVLPLKGVKSIQGEIDYPDNERAVIGAFEVLNDDNLSKTDISFMKSYSKQVGLAVHEEIMKLVLKQRKQNLVDFANQVQHDVRSPLASFGFFGRIEKGLKNLLDETLSKDEVADSIEEMLLYSKYIRNAEDRILNSIEFLSYVDISPKQVEENLEHYKLRPYLFNAFSTSMCERSDSDYNLVLSIDRKIKDKYYIFNKTFFDTIIYNLLGNSLKYTKRGGTSLLSVYEQSDMFVLDFLNSNDEIISMNDVDKLSEKGFRISKSIENSTIGLNLGLGLFAVKNIVSKAYQGEIRLVSYKDKIINQALDESKKEVMYFNQAYEPVSTLDKYFRAEVRLPLAKINNVG